MIRSAILLLGAYILAAPLTSLISLDLTLTAWTNVLTYVIWALAIPVWFIILVIIFAVIGALVNKG